jgi:DNA-binding NtrC family response regulator
MTRAGFLILHPEPDAPAMLAPMMRALGHDAIESASYRAARCVRPERPGIVVLGVDPIEPEPRLLLGALHHGEYAMPLILLYTAGRPQSISRVLDDEATAVLPFPLPASQLQAALTQALDVYGDCSGVAAPVPESAPVSTPPAPDFWPAKPYSPVAPTGGVKLLPLKQALEEPERAILLEALRAFSWNRNDTADALEISRSTLYHKMVKHGLFDLERA